MFFVFSKLLIFLLSPLLWVFICLILGIVKKKRAKLYFTLGFFALLIFSNPLLSNYILEKWEAAPTPKENLPMADIGILLAGTLNGEIPINDQLHFNEAADRVTETISLYKMGFIQKILISGGSASVLTDGLNESKALKGYLELSGIPPEDILMDTKSRNTHENALYSKEVLQKFHLADRKIVLITSAFHMRRALGCFQQQGTEVIPFAVDYRSASVSLDIFWILPSPGSFSTWNFLFKEWVGTLAYKMAGYI